MKLIDLIDPISQRIIQNNNWRQKKCINLIPSENTPSLLTRICEICDPVGRYAEHHWKNGEEIYYYQGINFIRDIEKELYEQMKKYFSCDNVELRSISGQMSNEVLFKSLVEYKTKQSGNSQYKRLKVVINNGLIDGGHLSAQPFGALFNYIDNKKNIINFPTCSDDPYKIDEKNLEEILNQYKPELIIFGKSMVICKEPIGYVKKITQTWPIPPIILYDMAHTLGLYGKFQKPLDEGADFITGSTHKTFFGSQRGIIAGNSINNEKNEQLWKCIKNRAFPGSTSNHHLGTLLALLIATLEINEFKDQYQKQVINNAKYFAKALKELGFNVQGNIEYGYTETHQVLVDVSQYGSGIKVANTLEENNIICNYQALPFDKNFSKCSGLRLGVNEMTRFGMKEDDFKLLANYMYECINKGIKVKEEITKFRSKFTEMKFCIPIKRMEEISQQIFTSLC